MDRQCCEEIMRKYYRELYNYIFAKVRDRQCAEDCTQELFMILLKKHPELNENDNIRIWLYRAADNVIRTYRRKNHSNDISLEDSAEAMNTPAPDCFNQDKPDLSEWLTAEETELVRLYYDTDYGDRKNTAQKLGITVTALYQKIDKIKKKIKNNIKKE